MCLTLAKQHRSCCAIAVKNATSTLCHTHDMLWRILNKPSTAPVVNLVELAFKQTIDNLSVQKNKPSVQKDNILSYIENKNHMWPRWL